MKNSTKKAQMKRFYECLKQRPKTTKMAAVELGIQRANLTRYVAQFEKLNIITVVEKKKCKITKHKAKYYSTDPALIPEPGQSEMFPPPNNPGPYAI